MRSRELLPVAARGFEEDAAGLVCPSYRTPAANVLFTGRCVVVFPRYDAVFGPQPPIVNGEPSIVNKMRRIG